MLGMYSLFTGGALEHCAVGALGIMPYISATIIIQLLTAVIPTLSKLAREEGGRTKIIQYGRYLTVLLCLGQGMVMAIGWENPEKLFPAVESGDRLVLYSDAHIWFYRLQTMLMLTTGTMLLMWLGEQITERGIGNGVSLVITIGILARLPQAASGPQGHVLPRRRGRGQVQLRPRHRAGAAAGRRDRRASSPSPRRSERSRSNTPSARWAAKSIPAALRSCRCGSTTRASCRSSSPRRF